MEKLIKEKKNERDQYTIVLEDINSKMDLVIESQHDLRDGLSDVKERVDVLEKGQRLTLDYLERIEVELHGELRTKMGVKDFTRLEKRVSHLEEKVAKR